MKLFTQCRIELSSAGETRRWYIWLCVLLLTLAGGSAATWWKLRLDRSELDKANAQLRAVSEKSSRGADGAPAAGGFAAGATELGLALRAIRFDWNEELQVLDRLRSSGVEANGWAARRDSDERQLIVTADSTAAVLEAVAALNTGSSNGRWYVAQIADASQVPSQRVKATLRRRP